MKKTLVVIRDGMLVTICSFIGLVLSFFIYYLLFMLFETIGPQKYLSVSTLRVSHGFIWLIAGLVIYKTKIPDWLKASVLAVSLGTFIIASGVQLYEKPLFITSITFLITTITILALYRKDKRWYHYYALALALTAIIIYL